MASENTPTNFLKAIGTILGLTIGFGIVFFWNNILQWVRSRIAPWLQRSNFKFLSPYLDDAYVDLEDLTTLIKQKAFKAWSLFSQYVFFQKVIIRREDTSFVRELESYATEDSTIENPTVEVIRTPKERMNLADLPDDVANAIRQNGYFERDITEDRDKEFMELGFSY